MLESIKIKVVLTRNKQQKMTIEQNIILDRSIHYCVFSSTCFHFHYAIKKTHTHTVDWLVGFVHCLRHGRVLCMRIARE